MTIQILNSQNWEELVKKAFENMKEVLQKMNVLEKDGSGNERFVALRKALDSLPCAVKILEIEFNERPKNIESSICALLHYDFERLGSHEIAYLGKMKITDSKFSGILRNEFQIRDPEKIRLFDEHGVTKSSMESDLSGNYHFVWYDPHADTNRFFRDFSDLFEHSFLRTLAQKYPQRLDFNKTYDLKPDPILSEEELVKRNPVMDSFVKLVGNKIEKITLEDIQGDVASFRLIPQVDENTKRVFERAKKLYIFGYYVYDFFPVSHHYAVLSLEVAIRNRYYAHFEFDVTVRTGSGKETKMHRVDHLNISDFCKENKSDGWNIKDLWIHHEKFETTVSGILGWMVKEKILTMWEKKRCKLHMWQRNYLSHQTFSPVYPWGTPHRAMAEVAYLINRIFSPVEASNTHDR